MSNPNAIPGSLQSPPAPPTDNTPLQQPMPPQARPGTDLSVPDAWRMNPGGYQQYIQDTQKAQQLRNESQQQIDRMNKFPTGTGGHGLTPAQTQAAYNARYGKIAPNPTGATSILPGGLIQKGMGFVDARSGVPFQETIPSKQVDTTNRTNWNRNNFDPIISKPSAPAGPGDIFYKMAGFSNERPAPVPVPFSQATGQQYLNMGLGQISPPKSTFKDNVQRQIDTMSPASPFVPKGFGVPEVIGNPAQNRNNKPLQTVLGIPSTIMQGYSDVQAGLSNKMMKIIPEEQTNQRLDILRAGPVGWFAKPYLDEFYKLPVISTLNQVERGYLRGEAAGWRKRPLDTLAITAATFALPAVGKVGKGVISRSPTLTSIADKEIIPKAGSMLYDFTGGRPIPSVGKLLIGTIETYPGSGKSFNVPVTLAETAIGVSWTQGVVDRVTGSAVSPGLSFDNKKGLQWKFDLNKLPSPEKMAYNAGEISSTEVMPAIAGAVAGDIFWQKVDAISRSWKKPYVNIRPEKGGPIPGGLGYEGPGYPVNRQVIRAGGMDLKTSFEKGTLIPEPFKLAGTRSGQSSKIEYVPRKAFLPTDQPNGAYMWTGWETDPGKIGKTFPLTVGESEMHGIYGAPVAEGHFTKAGMTPENRWQLFGIGFPGIREPTLIRTKGMRFDILPENIRTKDYPTINRWMVENGQPGVIYLPLKKMEYEGVIPAFTKEGQTHLEVTGRNYYTKIQGVRTPIVDTRATTIPWDVVNGQTKPGVIGKKEVIPGGLPEIYSPGGKGQKGGVSASVEEWYLSQVPSKNKRTAEALLTIGREIEGVKSPIERTLELNQVEYLRGYDLKIQKVLSKNPHVIVGSSIRTGQVPMNKVLTNFGKPHDIDLMSPNTRALAKDLSKTLPKNTFRVNPTFGGRYAVERKIGGSWETALDIHPISAVKHNNPLGWNPTTSARINKGGITYEPLFQQVQREVYGSMIGRKTRQGEWQFGPKPTREEKDIRGLLRDVDYLLAGEKEQHGITPKFKNIQSAMKVIKEDPTVAKIVKSNDIKTEFFSGLPLDRSLYLQKGKRALIEPTSLGVGTGIVNLLNTKPSRSVNSDYLVYNPGRMSPSRGVKLDISIAGESGIGDISGYSRPVGGSSRSNPPSSGSPPGRSSIGLPSSQSIRGPSSIGDISGYSRPVSGSSFKTPPSGTSIFGGSSFGNISGFSGGLSGKSTTGYSFKHPPTFTTDTPPPFIPPTFPPSVPKKRPPRKEEKIIPTMRHRKKGFFPFMEITPVASPKEFQKLTFKIR